MRLPLAPALCLILAACQQAAPDSSSANATAAPQPAAGSAVAPDAASPIKPGVYGNVVSSAESGDLGGVEIALHDDAPIVEMTLCEGWCNAIVQTRYRIDKGAVAFTFRAGNVNLDGSAAPDLVIPVRLVARGEDVLLEAPALGEKPTLLKRLPQRYGLDIAAKTMASAPRNAVEP